MRRLIGRLACWLKRWVEFNDQMWQLCLAIFEVTGVKKR